MEYINCVSLILHSLLSALKKSEANCVLIATRIGNARDVIRQRFNGHHRCDNVNFKRYRI